MAACCVLCKDYGAKCTLTAEHQLFTVDDERTFRCRVVTGRHTFHDSQFFGHADCEFWLDAGDLAAFFAQSAGRAAAVAVDAVVDAAERLTCGRLLQRHAACDTDGALGVFTSSDDADAAVLLTTRGMRQLGTAMNASRLVDWIATQVLPSIARRRVYRFDVAQD